MENKLSNLFDYQRFAHNKRLAEMIAETERRYIPVSDEDLYMVAAAGEADLHAKQQRETLFTE